MNLANSMYNIKFNALTLFSLSTLLMVPYTTCLFLLLHKKVPEEEHAVGGSLVLTREAHNDYISEAIC